MAFHPSIGSFSVKAFAKSFLQLEMQSRVSSESKDDLYG